jgi:flagella basal body P-ring formation protein FlgA
MKTICLLALTLMLSGCVRIYNCLLPVREIQTGEVIKESDLQQVTRPYQDRAGTGGWAEDRSEVVGHRAKCVLLAGQQFQLSDVTP